MSSNAVDTPHAQQIRLPPAASSMRPSPSTRDRLLGACSAVLIIAGLKYLPGITDQMTLGWDNGLIGMTFGCILYLLFGTLLCYRGLSFAMPCTILLSLSAGVRILSLWRMHFAEIRPAFWGDYLVARAPDIAVQITALLTLLYLLRARSVTPIDA